MNGVTLDSGHPVTVDTCATVVSLCTDQATGSYEPRKLVRVHVWATVDLAFLPVIGLYSVPISAEATSETASLDLVLVLDTSESMTFDALKPGDPGYDARSPGHCVTRAYAMTMKRVKLPSMRMMPLRQVKKLRLWQY